MLSCGMSIKDWCDHGNQPCAQLELRLLPVDTPTIQDYLLIKTQPTCDAQLVQ